LSKPRRFDWLFRPQMADEDLPLSAEALFAEALAELPAVERSALALSEIGGLDASEIAERLGTDPAVVRKLLARARESVRASLAMRGRGLTALLPFQSLWQTGPSAPVVRAAGVVAAAVIGPSVVVGGAGAEAPHAAAAPSRPLRVQAFERPERGALPVRVHVATAAVPSPQTVLEGAVAAERGSVRPGAGLRRDRGAAVASPSVPPPRAEPSATPVVRERPAPPPPAEPAPVAATVPLPVTPEPPLLPSPVPPVALPPVALPELASPPPLPPLP